MYLCPKLISRINGLYLEPNVTVTMAGAKQSSGFNASRLIGIKISKFLMHLVKREPPPQTHLQTHTHT